MTVFGVDTSNYATSMAVVNAAAEEVVCAKKRLLPVEEGKLGLRQSNAVFHHTAALPQMVEEFRHAGVLKNIKAVGVSGKPRPQEGSYMPCFLAGVSFAAAFAAALDVPLVKTSHQQGHLAAALFSAGRPALLKEEILFFHLSGGTTELLLTQGYSVTAALGKSLDLYAGQAIDRLGVKLGFAFPAGPAVSALALECGEEINPKVSIDGLNCHFSGLENQCARLLEEGRPPAYAARYCLLAVADTLAAMIRRAREARHGIPVLCAGGVASSVVVRQRLLEKLGNIHFAAPEYAGDNAVGVALIAAKEAQNG